MLCDTKRMNECPLAPVRPVQEANPTIRTQLLRVVLVGYACFLVCNAIFLMAVNLYFDLEETELGRPIGKPGVYAVGMMFMLVWAPVISIGSVAVSWFLSVLTFKSPGKAILASFIASGLSIAAIWLRLPKLFSPAFILMKLIATDGSIYVLGPAQIIAGLLLIYLSKHCGSHCLCLLPSNNSTGSIEPKAMSNLL